MSSLLLFLKCDKAHPLTRHRCTMFDPLLLRKFPEASNLSSLTESEPRKKMESLEYFSKIVDSLLSFMVMVSAFKVQAAELLRP